MNFGLSVFGAWLAAHGGRLCLSTIGAAEDSPDLATRPAPIEDTPSPATVVTSTLVRVVMRRSSPPSVLGAGAGAEGRAARGHLRPGRGCGVARSRRPAARCRRCRPRPAPLPEHQRQRVPLGALLVGGAILGIDHQPPCVATRRVTAVRYRSCRACASGSCVHDAAVAAMPVRRCGQTMRTSVASACCAIGELLGRAVAGGSSGQVRRPPKPGSPWLDRW